jgi:hypothetical protein
MSAVALEGTTERERRILSDPATPFWAAETLRSSLSADPVDAANVLAVLAELAEERARRILEANLRGAEL